MGGANNTKNLLAESLQDLMRTHPLEKISVNDIVEHAGVGRNTFYYHFADKYDLVNWCFQKGIMQFLTESPSLGNWQSILEQLEQYFREHQVFYTNALSYTGQNNLRDYIQQFLSGVLVQRLREAQAMQGQKEELSESELRFAGNFLSGALMGILLPWVQSGMKGHIANCYNCLRSLCSGRMTQIFFAVPTEELPAFNAPEEDCTSR
ncbi:TetR/AcrR family transcriptional regulator C-terminal domain-containing protein [Subdoligranulum sp. DSM 109015]|uniref:TetR/AcrR family transcriptional regulator C-terminal domain-containing protein n=1 Tax=Gemmiger gallinarum TaxID=2779354 RepID=A0ABR9R0E8_9FIRM|nr:TetR/AcrR family transcriptional regulator C-terminal domain-containing protein [Gemmiger gallinarum]MBE5036579.1 TetR/AcrR family transcriptional regulator C-terminal domain-containing protein [Gemmiger gallinarum]